MDLTITVSETSPNFAIADFVHGVLRKEGFAGARTIIEEAATDKLATLLMGRMGMGYLRVVADEMHVDGAETLGRIPLVRAILKARR